MRVEHWRLVYVLNKRWIICTHCEQPVAHLYDPDVDEILIRHAWSHNLSDYVIEEEE